MSSALLSTEEFRQDGRRPEELRSVHCGLGVFSQADGSAYIAQGNTKVLAAVYGPHEVCGSRTKSLHDQVLVNCQYSQAVFSTGERKRRPRGDRSSIEMTQHLRQTFDSTILKYLCPRSQIDIFLEVLQADGGNYSACVNAASLALMDAGVPLNDIVCACTASVVDDETVVVDVSQSEQTSGGGELTVALLPRFDRIALLRLDGRLHVDQLDRLLSAAADGCRRVHGILEHSVRQHASELAAAASCGV